MDETTATNAPDIVVYKLTEGFVMTYGGGYSVALSTSEQLAARVLEVGAKMEGRGFEVPKEKSATATTVQFNTGEAPTPAPPKNAPPNAPLKEATNIPTPATNLSIEQQWENVQKLMAFFAAGFDSNGNMFTREMWDEALPIFAPQVDPKEAEALLGEYLAELHDDDD